MKFRILVPLVLAAAATSSSHAADLPLGLVEAVDKTGVLVRFDAAARLALGQMVALHGPGVVVKHPLTGRVVTEQRKLLAKGQVVAIEGERLRLRVLWRSGEAQPEAGWDAVPLPGEAAPNAPPAASANLPAVSAVAGASLAIKLPVIDPDGDPLVVAWELIGATGRSGQLDARLTTQPEVIWTAPGQPPEGGIALKATVTDPYGQQAVLSLPLEVKGADDPRRARKVFAGLGTGLDPAWQRLDRAEDGSWIGVDDAGRVLRIGAGWQQAVPVALGEGSRRPVVAVLRGKELHVLDRDKAAVLIFTEAGQLRRSLGGLSEPSDLAVAADGTVYVADQRAGGVMVFDAGGRFRARVGRLGDDGFAEVSRLCTGPGGQLVVLDAQARRLHRFDGELRRLDNWTVTGDPKVRPIDVAVHPRGLVVLLEDGAVQLYGAKGTVTETWKPSAAAGLADQPGAAVAIATDASGEVLVCHAGGVTARLAADGRVLGLRGPGLLASATRWAVDGLGRILALDVDTGLLSVHDAEGWRTARIGGTTRSGGPFAEAGALAVVPDGSAIAVLDVDKRTVVRFDGRDLRKPPLVFGGAGSNNGQFKAPLAIAADEAGRSYVLDEDLYRVSVFDAGGQFLYAFGERGGESNQLDEPILVAVSPAGDAAYIFDEDRYEVKKYALDQQAKLGRHAATGGGKGSNPGQFRGAVAMLVDRQGLLHILDKSRGDWQTVDFRGQSLLPVAARPTTELLRGATSMAMSPDGTAWLAGGGSAVGLR
jgi:DNA-binding beta-propeller fold protein YncE